MSALRTPEFLAQQIGDVRATKKRWTDWYYLLAMSQDNLVAAIGHRPAIADELAEEATRSEVVAKFWAMAKAGLDARAAAESIDALLATHS